MDAKEAVTALHELAESTDAEGLVAGMAQLVLMRKEFESEELYRQLLKMMAVKLVVKVLSW